MTQVSGIETGNFHLHLTGSLPPVDIAGHASDLGLTHIPSDGLQNPLNFDEPYLWAAAKELTSTPEGLARSIGSVVAREAASGVDYVELTVNPYGMVRRGMSPDVIATTLDVTARDFPEVALRVKFGVNRKDGPDSVSTVRDVYEACPPELRFGIDLNGDEHQFPTEPFVPAFRGLREHGISTVIHAGEFVDCADSLRAALSAEPTRVAHAVAVTAAPDTLDTMQRQGTVVELAPLSNVQRQAVAALALHPIRRFLERDIPVVLGTDDPAFFGNTIADELEALRGTGLNEDEILLLNQHMQTLRAN